MSDTSGVPVFGSFRENVLARPAYVLCSSVRSQFEVKLYYRRDEA
jgi:hypothetical protein